MCGIVGLWNAADDEGFVAEGMRRMIHRGPDAEGTYPGSATPDRDRAGGLLGHRRLSIMDPAGGDQPIVCGSTGRAIIANGEIYNAPSLRSELSDRHAFATGSDTEAALHLYDGLAERTAERLDGMFAVAIADGPDLYLARDAIGIKPLYVGRRDGALAFASELKALVGQADDVKEFPPGTWFHTRRGWGRFYEVPQRHALALDEREHCRRLRDALERAVAKRMMSDVPVGAFLSGGLDSSILAAMVRRHVDALHTFSVGIEGSDDLQAARRVAEHLDTIHHEYVLTPAEIRQKLPEIVYHLESYDQDLVRSAIPCYFTSRLAAEHVKVVLTGEGADELFAGYAYYKAMDAADEQSLHDELRRSVASLHNVNLQRVDRLTMAHSLEGRVPFLDAELIALSLTIPAGLKLRRCGSRRVEKYVLRRACADLLPDEIVWRDKQQFDEGSGTTDVVTTATADMLDASGWHAYAARHRQQRLRSAEECAYHRLLCTAYDHSPVVLDNVARWAERPSDGVPSEVT
ncbi:MAG: asparagine synthase B [Phycisphaerae bacterium]|nr:asparagine synthase B [Phycisphaerae bacterium]